MSFQIPAAASDDAPAAGCWPQLWPPAGQIPPAGSAAAAASHWYVALLQEQLSSGQLPSQQLPLTAEAELS